MTKQVNEDIALLAGAYDWLALRSYFTYWKDEDELAVKVIGWCRFFLPQFFVDSSPPFHYELVKAIFSSKNEYKAAPRGFSKTTLIQGCLCFIGAHRLRRFVPILEKTHTEAAEILSAVRTQFVENPMILEVYGYLLGKDEKGNEPDKAKDTEGDMLINGVRYRAKGFNTSIRGLKSNENRPDLIICDDVEEDEHINSEEQRTKYKQNYVKGIIPALDIDCSVKVFGTILHNDSLLKNLIDQHDGKIYAAFDIADPQNTLLWAERWPYERLMRKKAEMEMEGLGASAFAQEYLNRPLDDESRKFHWNWLQKRFKAEDVDKKLFNRFACFDVADAKGEGNDWTFLTIVDWDSDNNWYVRHAKQKQVDSLELIDWIFEVWGYWKPNKIGVEKNAFEYQVRPLLKQKSDEKGIFPVVEELKDAGRNKEARIVGALQGRFESGKIFFEEAAKDDTGVLIGQLYDFPRGKHDDGPDALAYTSDIGQRPFNQKGRDDLLPPEHREFYAQRKLKELRSRQNISSRL